MNVKISFSVLALLLAATFQSCTPSDSAQLSANESDRSTDQIQVLTTFGLVTDVVSAVGGERVSITTMMGPGVDPHVYRPTPSDVSAMDNAEVIFYSGLGMEARLEEMFEKMSGDKVAYAITSAIPENMLRRPEEFEGQVDPHVWHDPLVWMYTIDAVEDALIELMPDHADEFRANAAAYRDEVQALHDEIESQLLQIPDNQRVLATAHDAFGYMAIRYDIDVMPIQGVTTEGEASIADIRQIATDLAERGVPAVFLEATVPPASINALREAVRSRGLDIKMGGELYADTVGPTGSGADTYVGMMRANVATIVEALK